MNSKTKGFIYGAIAAASYGMNPLFALPLYAAGMSVDTVLFYRYFFAVIVLGILMKMQHQSISLQKADILPLVIMGLLFSFSSLLLFMSYNYMDAGIASTILFVYPVMVAVIMGAFFKEKISAITIFSILLALSGIALLYQGDGGKPLSTVYSRCEPFDTEKPADNKTHILCHSVRAFGLYCPPELLHGTASHTIRMALGGRTGTGYSAYCRIIGMHSTGYPLYRLYTDSHLRRFGTCDGFVFRSSFVSRKTHAPVNGRYFNDYHRRYLDNHWQVAHKKDEYAVADEQKIIYFC